MTLLSIIKDIAIATAGNVPRDRPPPCTSWTRRTQLVGDGNPHQNSYNIQFSVSMESSLEKQKLIMGPSKTYVVEPHVAVLVAPKLGLITDAKATPVTLSASGTPLRTPL